LLTLNKPKFGQGSQELVEQFKLASELIARHYEGSTSCLPSLTLKEIKTRFQDCENITRIIDLFRRVNTKVVDIDFRKNNVLVFPYVNYEDENTSELEVYSFDNVFRAISTYNLLEEKMSNAADVVLVRADSFENMRVTFRNYFADTTDFVEMLQNALNK
jgi:putative GTP pyrophosphokinase